MAAPLDICTTGFLLSTWWLRVSGRIKRDGWRTSYYARGCDDVPLLESCWYGDLLSRAFSNEVPLHQPFLAYSLRRCLGFVQLAVYPDHVSSVDVGIMLCGWHG